MKKTVNQNIDHYIRNVIVATGAGSVVTQLLTIREFLSRLNGNEFVIALILFNWLFLSGIGTVLARPFAKHASTGKLYWISLLLIILAPAQLIAIRKTFDLVFIHGTSIGFYPTFAYTFFLIAPYSLILGFVLPYSLMVVRNHIHGYSATRIYIFDNIGDISGGALFSFILVYFATPFQAVFIGYIPLIVVLYRMQAAFGASRRSLIPGLLIGFTALMAAIFAEAPTLAPQTGTLEWYQETPYGRIQLVKNREQYTIFQNGRPVTSSQNQIAAEEIVHYPLSQLDHPDQLLMISAQSRMILEAQKYHPKNIDYVEIDPALTTIEFRFGLLTDLPGVNIIHMDGRRYLKNTKRSYDAIIMNLPEPDTFQINRFFTDRFFSIARAHLTDGGVLSFSVKGYDSYISDTELNKISIIYNTARHVFANVLMIPGSRIFFLCSDKSLDPDIPALLDLKGIATSYISGYYDGDVTPERIDRLNRQILSGVPINQDFMPHLVRVLLDEWFAVFTTSPFLFVIVLGLFNLVYFLVISREEFVLYSTGCFVMGAEILVIFAFQIFFGYVYLQIGLIITVFLAGLFPGAVYGEQIRRCGRPVLIFTEIALVALITLFLLAIVFFPDHLPGYMFLVFGFAVSVMCGLQFPVALYLQGDGRPAAVKMFSADLIGAAYGTLLTSILLIPYVGILWTAAAMILLKTTSLILLSIKR